jgi:uncharacterized protein YndB with AHSA1/START domain
MPNTVRLHRVLATRPEKVYRAFIEADALAKWLPPNGFVCTVHQLNAKVGGTFRMSFRNFTTGNNHSFGGEYIELVPHERLRYTDKFDDPNLPGQIQVTVTLKKVSLGIELTLCRKVCQMPLRWRLAISVGRSCCETWQSSSSLKSINSATAPYVETKGLSEQTTTAKERTKLGTAGPRAIRRRLLSITETGGLRN